MRRRVLTLEEKKSRREARARREARRMLRDLQRMQDAEEAAGKPLLTDWERGFQEGLPERLVRDGRGFFDPGKADRADPWSPMSRLQAHKVRQIKRLVRDRTARIESGDA